MSNTQSIGLIKTRDGDEGWAWKGDDYFTFLRVQTKSPNEGIFLQKVSLEGAIPLTNNETRVLLDEMHNLLQDGGLMDQVRDILEGV